MHERHAESTIRAALALIPADDRELWVRMGMALKSEYGEEGFALFDEWSQSAANYNARAAKDTWKSCKSGGGIAIGTLIHEAQQRGFDLKSHAAPVPLSKEDQDRIAAERAQREAQERQAIEKAQAQAARRAAAEWKSASDAGESAYLRRKKAQGYGVRYARDLLLVPVRDVDGKLWNLQRIDGEEGKEKLFLKGGRVSGCFHLIGQIEGASRLLIAEGYATGATLHEATGDPVAVAFSDTNLSRVAEALRQRYPDLLMAVCADDDRQREAETGKNPGIVGARNAARCGRAQTVIRPDLSGLSHDATDFNDLAAHKGLEEVRRQVDAAWATPESVDDATETPKRAKQASNGAVLTLVDGAGKQKNGAGEGKVAKQQKNAPRAVKSAGEESHSPRFEVNEEGVWYRPFSNSDHEEPPVWVCAPLRVIAQARNDRSKAWKYLLEFVDPDGKQKNWAMPWRMLSGDSKEYLSMLMDMGLRVGTTPKAKNLLAQYIQTARVPDRALLVDCVGWHDNEESKNFVLPNRTISNGASHALFDADADMVSLFQQSGTLDQWRDEVAALCEGNSRLVFCVSMAFAGVLLEPAGLQSGGFHLVGDSSSGKTTGLRMAASVFGKPDGKHKYMRSWKATDNALELVAAQHSDTLLILDEIGQVDSKLVGDIVYMLANESGKGRATRTATAKSTLTWRLLFLSDGEVKLSDHMLEAGKTARAGQEIRLANVPADAGMGLGIFEKLHGFASGKALADHLQKVASDYHGTAGLTFIEWVVKHGQTQLAGLRDKVEALVAEWVEPEAHGQVQRVATRFALVGLAGELASAAGITGWEPDEAINAAKACYEAWLDDRGGSGNSEEMAMVRQVRQFFEADGAARFTWMHRMADDHAPATMKRAGVRQLKSNDGVPIESDRDHMTQFGDKISPEDAAYTETDFFVFSQVFKQEVCKGFNYMTVARLLAKKGVLVHAGSVKDRRLTVRKRVPAMGSIYLYHITSAIFDLEI